MSRPALVKLGGSLVTDKSKEATPRRAATRRLLAEVAKSNVPCILLHGAGSFGHPQAKRHRIGQARARAEGVADVLASVGVLHADLVSLANTAGLQPLSIPLWDTQSDGDELTGLPVTQVQRALDEGYTPVLHGTLVRDDRLAWRVLSADELLARLAAEVQTRLNLWATDVDGVYDQDPDAPDATLLAKVRRGALVGKNGQGDDVTGRMHGKLRHAFAAAEHAPTLIVNGLVRNRVLDALRGKTVPGTRVEP